MLKYCSVTLLSLAFAGLLPNCAEAQCTAPAPLVIPDVGSSRSIGPIKGANTAAQTFTAPGNTCLRVESVQVWAKASGVAGSLLVAIHGVDSVGAPADQIGSSTTIDQFVSPDYVLKTASFSSPVPIMGGQQFAVVFSYPASTGGSAAYELRTVQNPDGGYAGGKAWTRDGSWGSQDNRDVVVAITFSCCPQLGCTYSQGYWKNHTALWPAFETMSLGNISYSPEQLQSILGMSVGGNDLVNLAHQLIAAKLNVLKGASSSTVAATIAYADGLIAYQNPLASGYLKSSEASGTAGILDRYNNGLLEGGPSHCGDED